VHVYQALQRRQLDVFKIVHVRAQRSDLAGKRELPVELRPDRNLQLHLYARECMHRHGDVPLKVLLLVAVVLGSARVHAAPGAMFSFPHPDARVDWYSDAAPMVASSGDGFLVLWHHTSTSFRSIMATRVDASGAIIDRYGIQLGPGTAQAIVWDGSAYVVVLFDVSNGTRLYAQTIGTDGVVGTRIELAAPAPFQGFHQQARIACRAPRDCIVVWWRFEPQVGHSIQYVTLNSTTVSARQSVVTAGIGDQHEPSIAWNGMNYLVAWRDIRRADMGDIYAARITATGQVLDPSGTAISTGAAKENNVAIIAAGSDYFVAWHDDATTPLELRGTRVAADGTPSTVGGARLVSRAQVFELGWDGSEYLLVYYDQTTQLARMSPTGTVATPVTVAAGIGGGVATAGTTTLVGWYEPFSADISAPIPWIRTLTGAATLGTPRWIPGTKSTEQSQQIGAGEGGYLVAWTDRRDGPAHVRATRVGPDATIVDGTGFVVTPPTRDIAVRSIASNGPVYLLAVARWPFGAPATEKWKLEVVRVAADGVVLDAMPFSINADATARNVTATWTGDSFLLAWVQGPDSRGAVVGIRVGADGTVLDAEPFPISRSPASADVPAIAANREVILVVWRDTRTGIELTGATPTAWGARLDRSGKPLDSADLHYAPAYTWPRVAASDGGFVVLSDSHDPDLHAVARRTDSAGRPVGEVFGSVPNIHTWDVAWDGTGWLIAAMVDGSSPQRTPNLYRIGTARDEIVDFGPLGPAGFWPIRVAGTAAGALLVGSEQISPDEEHLWGSTWAAEPPDPNPDPEPDPTPGDNMGGCCDASTSGPDAVLLVLVIAGLLVRRRHPSP
jgi:hypothetical protein